MVLKFVYGKEKPVKSSWDQLHHSGINTITYLKKTVKSGKEKVKMDADMMYLHLLPICVKMFMLMRVKF